MQFMFEKVHYWLLNISDRPRVMTNFENSTGAVRSCDMIPRREPFEFRSVSVRSVIYTPCYCL